MKTMISKISTQRAAPSTDSEILKSTKTRLHHIIISNQLTKTMMKIAASSCQGRNSH